MMMVMAGIAVVITMTAVVAMVIKAIVAVAVVVTKMW